MFFHILFWAVHIYLYKINNIGFIFSEAGKLTLNLMTKLTILNGYSKMDGWEDLLMEVLLLALFLRMENLRLLSIGGVNYLNYLKSGRFFISQEMKFGI